MTLHLLGLTFLVDRITNPVVWSDEAISFLSFDSVLEKSLSHGRNECTLIGKTCYIC